MRNLRAAVRFVGFVLLTFGLYAVWWAGSFLTANENSQIKWRQFILRHWARGFVLIAGMRLEVKGNPPAPPFLLVSNHLGYIDVAALRASAECVFVAKSEIESWFLAGTMIRNLGMIFTNRENRRDIPRAGAKIVEAMEQGEGIVIFAEGTTSDGSRILPFKSSFLEFAAERDLPVYYATLFYETPPGEKPASEVVCWWQDEVYFVPHIFEMFKMPGFYGTVTFGDAPISFSNRKELAEKLHQAATAQFTPVE